MKLKRASLVLAAPVTALLAVATPAVSASAAPTAAHPTKVPCRTWVSNSKPKDYSTVDVWVATARDAGVQVGVELLVERVGHHHRARRPRGFPRAQHRRGRLR